MEIKRPESKQPLPKNARLVFKGVIFDVYQWEVEAYDGSKKMFEKLKRPDTVAVIPVTEEGKILITFQEQPHTKSFIGLPGGRVDEGENVLTAAKRELLEETGYEATEWILFDAIQPITKIEWAVYTFIAKGCKKVAEQDLDGGEKIQLDFVNLDEFIDLVFRARFDNMEVRRKMMDAKLDPKRMRELEYLLLK